MFILFLYFLLVLYLTVESISITEHNAILFIMFFSLYSVAAIPIVLLRLL